MGGALEGAACWITYVKSLGRGWIYIKVEEGLVKELKKKIKEKRINGHIFALSFMIE